MNARKNLIEELKKSIEDTSFVKLTLSKPTKKSKQSRDVKKVLVRPIKIKNRAKLSLIYRHPKVDITKNYDVPKGVQLISNMLQRDFLNVNLFTTKSDFQFEDKKIKQTAPTFTETLSSSHDKVKARIVPLDRPFLQSLGVVGPKHNLKKEHAHKYKQICSFIDILAKRVHVAGLDKRASLKMVDMGCGNAYLTFAAYDYLNNILGIPTTAIGIDINQELVSHGFSRAKALNFEGLSFERSKIASFPLRETDILVSLHACDTATDDTLYKGIRSDAQLILCSPCCHHEIRTKMRKPPALRDLLRYGVFAEDVAEVLTDSFRALFLNSHGYSTDIFEFVGGEHSAKNNIIVAVKGNNFVDKEKYGARISALKELFGIEELYLEKLLLK
jgi:SAM-dependent methyltransferase